MQIKTKFITDGAVTNAKLANMAAQSVKANLQSSAAVPSDISIGTLLGFDAIVGTNGTHADINAVMADTNIANIKRVLVISSSALTTTQTISHDGMEFIFKSNVTYSKSSATKGISINANNVTLTGGVFSGFNGGSDVAIQIETSVNNNLIQVARFANNTTAVNDLGNNSTLSSNIDQGGNGAGATISSISQITGYDAVVGTGGSHASINAVLADSNIANIKRVLVVTSVALATTQTISQPDMEFIFKAGVVYSKASATKGISINADRVTITGGRFSGFNGGGDTAIQIESGKKNNLIQQARFNTNTTSIIDSGTNSTLNANIEEV